MSFSIEDDTDDESEDSFQSEDEEVSDQLSNDSKSDQDKSFSASDSSSVSPWDSDPELQAIKGAMFISIARVQNTEHSRCAIHNKVIEPHAINRAFDNPHSHVTIERMSREDAIPYTAVKGDMMYGFLFTRSAAIPTKQYAVVFCWTRLGAWAGPQCSS